MEDMLIASPSGDPYMNVPSPSGDMEPKFLKLSESHMFRHNSEIKKQLKGGYLKGSIRIPSADNYMIELSLRPTQDQVKGKAMKFHPCLLFVANHQKRKGRRGRKPAGRKRKRVERSESSTEAEETSSESEPQQQQQQQQEVVMRESQWRVTLWKRGRSLRLKDAARGEWLDVDGAMSVDAATGETALALGKEELEVTIIKPLIQEGKRGGVHIRRVLESIFDAAPFDAAEWTTAEAHDAFVKARLASLNEVRMHVKILTADAASGGGTRVVGEDTSAVISNSKDRANNPLRVREVIFPDDVVCARKEQSMAMVVLDKEIKDEIAVQLVIVNNNNSSILQHGLQGLTVEQPLSVRQIHNVLLHVRLPRQSDELMAAMQQHGCSIAMVLSRNNRSCDADSRTEPRVIPYAMRNDSEHCCLCRSKFSMPMTPPSNPDSRNAIDIGSPPLLQQLPIIDPSSIDARFIAASPQPTEAPTPTAPAQPPFSNPNPVSAQTAAAGSLDEYNPEEVEHILRMSPHDLLKDLLAEENLQLDGAAPASDTDEEHSDDLEFDKFEEFSVEPPQRFLSGRAKAEDDDESAAGVLAGMLLNLLKMGVPLLVAVLAFFWK